MKAAVLLQKDGMLQYTEKYPEPIANSGDETIITMKAAALKHLDRSQATGKHYSTENDISQAKVIGGDGVGLLPDGTRVYALGVSGMLAEKAVVEKDRMVKIPAGLNDGIAAALPNAVIGSAMALRYRAALQKGETVLINGATSFTGKIAVQIARHYGADRIIVTGRNEQSLQELKALGADETVSTQQAAEDFTKQIKAIHAATPIDVIIDYLWGNSAGLILEGLKGKGNFTHPTRFVSVGSITGDILQLSSQILRSVNLHINGSGLGSWTKEQVKELFRDILPEMLELAAAGKLQVDITTVQLEEIEQLWEMEVPGGNRLVVLI